jgi:hypothetical protein
VSEREREREERESARERTRDRHVCVCGCVCLRGGGGGTKVVQCDEVCGVSALMSRGSIFVLLCSLGANI